MEVSEQVEDRFPCIFREIRSGIPYCSNEKAIAKYSLAHHLFALAENPEDKLPNIVRGHFD